MSKTEQSAAKTREKMATIFDGGKIARKTEILNKKDTFFTTYKIGVSTPTEFQTKRDVQKEQQRLLKKERESKDKDNKSEACKTESNVGPPAPDFISKTKVISAGKLLRDRYLKKKSQASVFQAQDHHSKNHVRFCVFERKVEL